jgi:hypothetical protein
MVRGSAHVARMFRGRARSLSVQGVSVPRAGRVRPRARSGPWDGGGRRSSRRRIALRASWRRRERENEGDADRGEDCVAHCQFPLVWPRRWRSAPEPLYARPAARRTSPRTRPPTPPSSRARDWPTNDGAGRQARRRGPRAAQSSRARRIPLPGTSLFALAFSVIAPPNSSVLHAAWSGAERGSARAWTGPPGLSASSTQ